MTGDTEDLEGVTCATCGRPAVRTVLDENGKRVGCCFTEAEGRAAVDQYFSAVYSGQTVYQGDLGHK